MLLLCMGLGKALLRAVGRKESFAQGSLARHSTSQMSVRHSMSETSMRHSTSKASMGYAYKQERSPPRGRQRRVRRRTVARRRRTRARRNGGAGCSRRWGARAGSWARSGLWTPRSARAAAPRARALYRTVFCQDKYCVECTCLLGSSEGVFRAACLAASQVCHLCFWVQTLLKVELRHGSCLLHSTLSRI